MDRTRRLEMLVRAADFGSFAAAARALDLTPSAISRGISELEQALRVTLFNRTTRQLQLTDDGRQVYQRAQDILERMPRWKTVCRAEGRVSRVRCASGCLRH